MTHHHRRARISPLQVIQNKQHRRTGGQSREELHRRVKQPEPFLIRLQGWRWGELRQQLRQTRRDPRQHAGGRAKIGCKPPPAHRLAVPGDRFGERAERRHPRALDTAAGKHNSRAGPRAIGELLQRVGLANSRLTRQENHTTPPGGRFLEASQQTRHLRAAAEIHPPGHLPRPLLRMPGEPGRLLQDRLMQVTQLSARIDPQILLKDPPQLAERAEGLRLPPVAVKRDHQLAPPPFTQRTTGHQGLKAAHHFVVAAQRELRIEQILQRRLAQLLKPQRFRSRERAAGELGQRRAPPQAQGPPQQPRGHGRVAPRHLLAGLTDQALRQPRVHHARRGPQAVPGWQGHDAQPPSPGQRTADAKHIVLQRFNGRPGRIIPPQRIHQIGSTDSLTTMHRQRREQATLLDPTQPNRSLTHQLDRAKDPEPPALRPHTHPNSVSRARLPGQGHLVPA